MRFLQSWRGIPTAAIGCVAIACAVQVPGAPTDTSRSTLNQAGFIQFSGGICSSFANGGCVQYPQEVHHTLSVKRAVTVAVGVSWGYAGDYSPDVMTLQVTCEGSVIARQQVSVVSSGRASAPFSVALNAGCPYDFQLNGFYDNSKAFPAQWTYYTITITDSGPT